MKYNTDWLLAETEQQERIKYLYFWGNQASRNGQISASCFSQWWEGHPFTLDNQEYRTAEHYMMAGKARVFEDPERLDKILTCKSPGEAKKLGRQVQGFDHEVWMQHACEIVIQGNYAKFSQHPDLLAFILNTQNRILVEASPLDSVWGIGLAKDDDRVQHPMNWKGTNLLGFCLMETRDRLRKGG